MVKAITCSTVVSSYMKPVIVHFAFNIEVAKNKLVCSEEVSVSGVIASKSMIFSSLAERCAYRYLNTYVHIIFLFYYRLIAYDKHF